VNLETGTGRKLTDPSASQIAEELAALSGGGDSFAVLSRDELTYIQAAGARSEGFVLEYQEGSIDQHYRSTEDNLHLSTVTDVFQLYAVGDSAWRSRATWRHDDLVQHSGCLPLLGIALAAPTILGLVLW
jgi:hypothetical protein